MGEEDNRHSSRPGSSSIASVLFDSQHKPSSWSDAAAADEPDVCIADVALSAASLFKEPPLWQRVADDEQQKQTIGSILKLQQKTPFSPCEWMNEWIQGLNHWMEETKRGRDVMCSWFPRSNNREAENACNSSQDLMANRKRNGWNPCTQLIDPYSL